MALTKEVVVDQIEVLESGVLQVRQATYIVENGVRIMGPTYHRVTLEPGADVAEAPSRVQAIAGAVWTPEVVDTRKARMGGGAKGGGQ